MKRDLTIRQVAKAAGVSAATVSRVLNAAPNIPAATRTNVERVVAELNYSPVRKRRRGSLQRGDRPPQVRRIGFFIVEHNPYSANPAYEYLLRGVTRASEALGLDLQVGFIDSHDDLAARLGQSRFGGVLLHGTPPSGQIAQSLQDTPTVWLMGGRRRPTWGDQVMPDNHSIGVLAANFLWEQGHRHVMYFGIDSGWSLHERCSAFTRSFEQKGGKVAVLEEPMADVARQKLPLLDQTVAKAWELYRSCTSKPTGVFVAEDWLLRPLYVAAKDAGVAIGQQLSIISCNNHRPNLEGLNPVPPSIDLRIDQIASRGVEQLIYRMERRSSTTDRLRVLVDPAIPS